MGDDRQRARRLVLLHACSRGNAGVGVLGRRRQARRTVSTMRQADVSTGRKRAWELIPARTGVMLTLLAFVAHALAETVEITPADDFEVEANALSAGDELILHRGTYLFDG